MSYITEITEKLREFIREKRPSSEQKNLAKKEEESKVMTEEEKLDESLKETFPASDPPGHFAKSSEDLKYH